MNVRVDVTAWFDDWKDVTVVIDFLPIEKVMRGVILQSHDDLDHYDLLLLHESPEDKVNVHIPAPTAWGINIREEDVLTILGFYNVLHINWTEQIREPDDPYLTRTMINMAVPIESQINESVKPYYIGAGACKST